MERNITVKYAFWNKDFSKLGKEKSKFFETALDFVDWLMKYDLNQWGERLEILESFSENA